MTSSNSENSTVPYQNPIWDLFAIFYVWRRFIIVVTLLVTIAAAGISWFMLPNVYTSSTSLLLPPSTTSGSLQQALSGRGLGSVSSLLGGAGGDYVKYMGILMSRRVMESVVRKFDLIRVYDIQEPTEGERMEKALKELSSNVSIEIDPQLEYLVIKSTDVDPKRAANMANYMTGELNRISAEMFSSNARTYRTYMETRYNHAKNTLDSLLTSMSQFQQRYGVIELPKQVEAFYSTVAQYRMEVAKAEITAQTLSSQLGSENPQVKAAQEVYQQSQRQLDGFISGQDQLMQVSFNEMPSVTREYVGIFQGITTQQKILEALTPIYEQAQFDEKRTIVAVQVLDEAKPSPIKSGPKRSVLVAVSAMSALVIAMFLAFVMQIFQRNRASISKQLNEAIEEQKRMETA